MCALDSQFSGKPEWIYCMVVLTMDTEVLGKHGQSLSIWTEALGGKETLLFFPRRYWVYLAHKYTPASALVKKSVPYISLGDVKFYSSSDLTQLLGLQRSVCCGLQEISSSPGKLLNLGSVFWQRAIRLRCRAGCGFSSRIATFLQEATGWGNFNFSYWTWNHLSAYAAFKRKESMVILCSSLWKHCNTSSCPQTAKWHGVWDLEELSRPYTWNWPDLMSLSPKLHMEIIGLLYC